MKGTASIVTGVDSVTSGVEHHLVESQCKSHSILLFHFVDFYFSILHFMSSVFNIKHCIFYVFIGFESGTVKVLIFT